jgi:predicted MFS family arabinose efflux permease
MRSLSAIYRDPRAHWFLATMLLWGVAAGLFGGVLNNYLHEVLAIGKLERGLVEFPRELPGLLLMGLIALLYRLSEVRILRFALMLGLSGMIGIYFVGDKVVPAIGMIVLYSTCEHLMMPVAPSVAMHMAKTGKEGAALGSVGSVGSLGQVIGYYLVPLLVLGFPMLMPAPGTFAAYRVTFVAVGIILLLALVVSTRLPDQGLTVKRERLSFDRKYSRYYVLEVLFGARKQVFITFAPYVLVMVYGVKAEYLATLYGVCALLNIFVGPLIGRIVDRKGYRTVIIGEAGLLIGVCFVYGFAHRFLGDGAALVAVSLAFVGDALLFTAGMARSVYVRSLAKSREEVTSTLSTGISINHSVSIAIALVGGAVWQTMGVETLFTLSAAFAVTSLFFAAALPRLAPPSAAR